MTTSHYTFRDTDAAAYRLELLAQAFEPSSRALLERSITTAPQLAVDLGSGPGFTTELVRAATGARRSVGLERSGHFLTLARARFPALEFIEADLSQAALPVSGAELVYCRFLVTHLADVVGALRRARDALAQGGRFVVEELLSLESPDPVLQRYYDLVAAMQRHYGQSFQVGRELAGHARAAGFEIVSTEAVPLPLDAAVMAELHTLNLANFRHDPYIEKHVAPSEVDEIATGLAEIAAGRTPASVRYVMMQLVATR